MKKFRIYLNLRFSNNILLFLDLLNNQFLVMSSLLTPKSKNKQSYSTSKKNLKLKKQDLIQNDSISKHNQDILLLTPPSSTVLEHQQLTSPSSPSIAEKSNESETELIESKCLKFSSDLDELTSKIKVLEINY